VVDLPSYRVIKGRPTAWQFMLCEVEAAQNMPMHYEALSCTMADAPILFLVLIFSLKGVMTRSPHTKRAIAVADRALRCVVNIPRLYGRTRRERMGC
jgi:hypothetical protein